MDTVPRMPRLTPPRRALHKGFHIIHIFLAFLIKSDFTVPDLIYACFFLSRDCPIFYRRKNAQKDMAEAKMQLDWWNFWAPPRYSQPIYGSTFWQISSPALLRILGLLLFGMYWKLDCDDGVIVEGYISLRTRRACQPRKLDFKNAEGYISLMKCRGLHLQSFFFFLTLNGGM